MDFMISVQPSNITVDIRAYIAKLIFIIPFATHNWLTAPLSGSKDQETVEINANACAEVFLINKEHASRSTAKEILLLLLW